MLLRSLLEKVKQIWIITDVQTDWKVTHASPLKRPALLVPMTMLLCHDSVIIEETRRIPNFVDIVTMEKFQYVVNCRCPWETTHFDRRPATISTRHSCQG